MTVWYDRDLSAEEICSNNSGILNRESHGADICRKVSEQFQGIAAANRSRYRSVEEMTNAVWAKYSLGAAYKGLSKEQKEALARTEIEMTMFGTVHYGYAKKIAKMDGVFAKSRVGKSENADRAFNVKMLGIQIGNVLKNNGINLGELGNRSFHLSVNGRTNKLTVTLIGGDPDSEGLIERIEKALNTKENAQKLFFNLLYDSNKRGLLLSDQLAKWKFYHEFQSITGRDLQEFAQTDEGFVDYDGRMAREVYKEALKETKKVPAEFKGVAYNHFIQLEKEAMRYSIAEIPDLILSLEYKDGGVSLPDDRCSFNQSA